MEIRLQGRTVLITGGSRGLGLVLAREFAREGAHIAICARDPDELGRAEGDLRERGALGGLIGRRTVNSANLKSKHLERGSRVAPG
jgi:NAD(P)-dependent dehydrogenase (short-subunit alcohol dehydrogenase family)